MTVDQWDPYVLMRHRIEYRRDGSCSRPIINEERQMAKMFFDELGSSPNALEGSMVKEDMEHYVAITLRSDKELEGIRIIDDAIKEL